MQGMIGIVDAGRIGGGEVFRPFVFHGEKLLAGTRLTREQILTIPAANLRALVNHRFMTVWPTPDGEGAEVLPGIGAIEKFVIPVGGGKFGVVIGRRLSAELYSREDAQAIAEGKREV